MITGSEKFWKVFKETPGALSCAEAIAIMNIAREAPDGVFAEFGTHKGKSSVAAIYGAMFGARPKSFYLNDLIFEDTAIINQVQHVINAVSDYKINTRYYQCESVKLIPQYRYAYAFLDTGDHGEELVQSEKVLLEDAMISGGILAFHDLDNQFTAVRKAYNELLATDKYEEVKIDWPVIFKYVQEHNLEEGNNSWHQYQELPHPPNFVGALKRK